jgi:hypothetical protein
VPRVPGLICHGRSTLADASGLPSCHPRDPPSIAGNDIQARLTSSRYGASLVQVPLNCDRVRMFRDRGLAQ